MKEWTREERYRVLNSPEEIRALHEQIKASDYRLQYHIQPVTGLLNDPNGFLRHHDGSCERQAEFHASTQDEA